MKGPRVDKYDCPICEKPMRVSFGSPVEANGALPDIDINH